jgi:hypothetical protein
MGELGRYRHREPGQEPLSVGIYVAVRRLDSHTPSEGGAGAVSAVHQGRSRGVLAFMSP